ncbi:right-handed parallel beta-helix repeat-containing protein [Pseudonocardia abyssalis]|uniref:Right-handed parallel beta-helix repeat-containing protein n=1 Tax=Pseudonocardia abyssalis TaxID=2792008 RepID=A0ABS6UXV4_9PSEU|nr:right-handed parallel beta-helix repeat-containing protein [Pseudonocardia abyssalis]MBW0118335.1 right-handed parallel beta-helix repeat-containing protein [Pseudonocardia abyssalis]MBW0137103.1 right-handed parallel beta-helix repeat-containing protein [Pseudonocardia abyssalis]
MRRILLAGALLVLAACSAPAPLPVAPAPITATGDCAGGVPVADGDELIEALAGAHPGTVIALAPGTYRGNFVARTTGTPDAPITLCGPREAVLDGGPVDGDYTLHLDGVAHWQLRGFTVRGGQKGVMVDGGQRVLLDGLLVEGTGDEAVHLRRHSSDNVVRGLTIRDTGLRRDKFGEGIYVGSAESNWCELTGCEPDRSDRNTIEDNTISGTTSESVDIKEGTTGGLLRGNRFDGAGMTAADAWVNVKGNGWTIAGNTGIDSPEDGFQVFEILDGWGLDNTFTGNTATVNADGYAFNITRNDERNRVSCDNTATGAGKGLTRAACT